MQLDPHSSVTSVLSKAEIDAPVELVWNAILDFPSYTQWNPFVRYQAVMDASWKTPHSDQKPVLGSNILMRVPMPPAVGMMDPSQVKSTTREVITYLNEDTKTVIWDLVSIPSWFLRSRREQTVVEVEKDGKKIVKYTSLEIMDGPGAWIIKLFMLGRLQSALDAVGDALKTYVEQKARENHDNE